MNKMFYFHRLALSMKYSLHFVCFQFLQCKKRVRHFKHFNLIPLEGSVLFCLGEGCFFCLFVCHIANLKPALGMSKSMCYLRFTAFFQRPPKRRRGGGLQ